MRKRVLIVLAVFLVGVCAVKAQDPNQSGGRSGADGLSPALWIALGMFLMAVLNFLARRWEWWRGPGKKKKEKQGELEVEDEHQQGKKVSIAQTDRERLENTLRLELGSVRMLGSPDIPNVPVQLLDTFVSLDISTAWRTDLRFDREGRGTLSEPERNLNPDTVIQRAFQNYRMLLLIGDPGSGKTTLLKYYAMCCLSDEYAKLGFDRQPLPIYLPLRRVAFQDEKPLSLAENLQRWADDHQLGITAATFQHWLDHEPVLLLLDGLDEISDLDRRCVVCEWIDGFAPGLQTACSVVTSRWTGYRKVDGIEIGFEHLRADLQVFSLQRRHVTGDHRSVDRRCHGKSRQLFLAFVELLPHLLLF